MAKIIAETFPRNISSVVNSPNNLWPLLDDPTQLHQGLIKPFSRAHLLRALHAALHPPGETAPRKVSE